MKWSFTTGGDVSATPAVDGDTVYFPDGAGSLSPSTSGPASSGGRRASPPRAASRRLRQGYAAIGGNKLILGTQGPFGGGGKVLAFDKDTGALLWSTTLDTHPAAIITQSATVYGNRVYVGTSSLEETKCRLAPGALRTSCFRLSVGDGCAYEIGVAVRMHVLCFVSNASITQGKGLEF